MKNIIVLKDLNKRTVNEELSKPAQPETLNIYLHSINIIPEDILGNNDYISDEMMNRQSEHFIINEIEDHGDWALRIGIDQCGNDVYVRYGYVWGDIHVFDGIEYFAQHSDTQFHAQEGWRVRVKFDQIDWILAKPGYYRSEDGKKILWREVEEPNSPLLHSPSILFYLKNA